MSSKFSQVVLVQQRDGFLNNLVPDFTRILDDHLSASSALGSVLSERSYRSNLPSDKALIKKFLCICLDKNTPPLLYHPHAVKITKSVGSMWCAYVFTLLALISLPAALRSGDLIVIVSWIAQTFLQLVLLPIIIVGQSVQATASDARAESDHDTLISIYTLTSEVHGIAEQQTKILEILEERTKTSKE